jgi:hypothetical protein
VAKLTPGRVIRTLCVDCVGGAADVKDCRGDTQVGGPCLFFPFRMGKGRPKLRVIRQNCLACMGGSVDLVRKCASATCKAVPYRGGHRPKDPIKAPEMAPERAICDSESFGA